MEGVERIVEAYREDIKGFQVEIRQEMKSFQIEVRAENEKFRQEVNVRFATIEGRLFDMQKALTTQTRWLLSLLVAVPVIYSLMQKLLGL